jgi:hemerythrin superfamily protein
VAGVHVRSLAPLPMAGPGPIRCDGVMMAGPSRDTGFTRGMECSPLPPPPEPERPVDAIQLLKADHKKVKELLAELAKTTTRAAKTRSELLAQIRVDLEVHTTIEEEIFYPAFRKAGTKDDAKMYFEALEEHRAAGDLVLPDLLDTDVGSEQFSGRAKVLRELVEHHVKEEEEEMFKEAKKLLSAAELKALGARMEQRKVELAKQVGGSRGKA